MKAIKGIAFWFYALYLSSSITIHFKSLTYQIDDFAFGRPLKLFIYRDFCCVVNRQ